MAKSSHSKSKDSLSKKAAKELSQTKAGPLLGLSVRFCDKPMFIVLGCCTTIAARLDWGRVLWAVGLWSQLRLLLLFQQWSKVRIVSGFVGCVCWYDFSNMPVLFCRFIFPQLGPVCVLSSIREFEKCRGCGQATECFGWRCVQWQQRWGDWKPCASTAAMYTDEPHEKRVLSLTNQVEHMYRSFFTLFFCCFLNDDHSMFIARRGIASTFCMFSHRRGCARISFTFPLMPWTLECISRKNRI